MSALVEVKNLKKYFETPMGMLHAVDDISFSIEEGKTMGIVDFIKGKTRQSICNDREPSPLLVEKLEKGELGVKSGKGRHDYQGRTRNDVLEQSNRKLLQQLSLFRSLEKKEE